MSHFGEHDPENTNWFHRRWSSLEERLVAIADAIGQAQPLDIYRDNPWLEQPGTALPSAEGTPTSWLPDPSLLAESGSYTEAPLDERDIFLLEYLNKCIPPES